MAASDYYDDTYIGIEELCARAQQAGARRVGVVEAGWQKSPGGHVYQVTAEVETADGRVCRRLGRARPGDSKAPNPPKPAEDDQVETRAEARAVRAAIRTAYPTAELEDSSQPPHVKRAQALVRQASAVMGMTRDELAAVAHKRYKVESLNDLTEEQADGLEVWLEPFVTSSEGV